MTPQNHRSRAQRGLNVGGTPPFQAVRGDNLGLDLAVAAAPSAFFAVVLAEDLLQDASGQTGGQAPHLDVAVTLADTDGEAPECPRDSGQVEVHHVGFTSVDFHAEPGEVAKHQ